MVVVEREAEAESLDRLKARSGDPHAPVRELVRDGLRGPATDVERGDEHPVAKRSCRVTGDPCRQRKGIRPSRTDDRLDHSRTLKPEGDGFRGYALTVAETGMRSTWDAAATSEDVDAYVGDPETAEVELDGLFGRLGADPRGGTCLEVGCGPGRMTRVLAERFDQVVAADVSSEMLALARKAVDAPNVELRLVSGERLDSIGDGEADVLVCYLVLQHLPDRRFVAAYIAEFGRVLRPAGQAFVQIPVMRRGLVPSAWRAMRLAAVPLTARRGRVADQSAYRGVRLNDAELDEALATAGLTVSARDESDTSPYRHAREVFLRLEHA